MPDTFVLQTPIDRPIMTKAKEEAKKVGFRSLQDLVSVFLSQVAEHGLSVSLGFDQTISVATEERLSAAMKQAEKEISNGEAQTLSSAQDVLAELS